jgi:ribulose-phosphate 3-epimerase
MNVKVSASLLAANFARLGAEILTCAEAGVDRFHFDIMDGHFVPNIAFGPGFLSALRSFTDLPFEAHLMMTPVAPYLENFAKSGADIILIHPESGVDLDTSLRTIRHLNKKSGIVLNPTTPVDVLHKRVDLIDQVLVMTVNPGFSGQKFMSDLLPKIKRVREMIGSHPIDLAVDGGIGPDNARQVITAGANILVAGSAIFKDHNVGENIHALRIPFGFQEFGQAPER